MLFSCFLTRLHISLNSLINVPHRGTRGGVRRRRRRISTTATTTRAITAIRIPTTSHRNHHSLFEQFRLNRLFQLVKRIFHREIRVHVVHSSRQSFHSDCIFPTDDHEFNPRFGFETVQIKRGRLQKLDSGTFPHRSDRARPRNRMQRVPHGR